MMVEHMKKRILGIKWKLFGYLLGFCLLLLIILTLFQTVFLERFYIMIKQNQVEREITDISAYVEAADWEGLEEAAGEPGDIFVEIWNLERGMIITTGHFQEGIHTQLNPGEMEELLAQLQEEGGSITRRYFESGKGGRQRKQNLVSAQLVKSADGASYVSLVSAGLSPVNATIETLRLQLVYISGAMMILSIGLALLISRKVSKPIVSISRTAGELGRGNYNVVFKGSGYQEVVHLADILTEAAAELSKTEELRKELISNVSHDLKTPLTLISGYSEMIRDMPEEATPENMQVIIDETNRLSSLVNELLDLSRLQAGTEQLVIEPFDLRELAEEIVGRVSRFCQQEGYLISFSANEAAILVDGDRERIAQVIYNFLLNALNHTGPDKKVLVSLTVKDQTARMEITDTGPGISAEELPYIWERYYKIDKSYQRAVKGTGLGLSIVRSILEQHPDVDYGVSSDSGHGSTFWFSMRIK